MKRLFKITKCFLIIAYEKAAGQLPGEKDWDAELFKTWGSLMGKIHRLSKKYSPSETKFRRVQWNEMEFFNFEKYIPHSDILVSESARKLVEKIKSFSQEPSEYGLIHGDFHHLNYFVKNGEITVFDFDDIHYNWFAYDIACILYYVHRRILRHHNNYTEYFYKNFMSGYNQYNILDKKWLNEIHTFLKLRHIVSYIILNQVINVNNMDENLSLFYNSIKNEIEQNKNIIDYDFVDI